MGGGSTPDPVTFVYKTIYTPTPSADGKPSKIQFRADVYPPNSYSEGTPTSEDGNVGAPAVVYFHGGALVVGNRKSWFPVWLHGRLSKQGVAVISADYRLLPSSTGHDIVEDIRDLFAYIRNDLNSALARTTEVPKLKINIDALSVAGASAGGLCAYLCAMHVSPKPIALLSMYGQGGECLNDHFLEPKTEPWVPGRPLVDPSDLAEFIFPQSMSSPVTVDTPEGSYPSNHPTPGFPMTKRMQLTRLYYQLGEWLDYYTGDHTLSRHLRQLRPSPTPSSTESPSTLDPIKAREVIGEKHAVLFPQFGVAGDWPPSLFVHGSEDPQVPLYESEHLVGKLRAVGVENKLIVIEGKSHAFDLVPDAEEEFGGLFDQVSAFLVQHLQK